MSSSISVRKGTSPENIEVMKAFLKECPEVVITGNREKTDYVVRFDGEGPSPIMPFVKGKEVAVLERQSKACATIREHAASRP